MIGCQYKTIAWFPIAGQAMKSSFRVLTIALSLTALVFAPSSLASEEDDWLNDIGEKPKAAAPVKKTVAPSSESGANSEGKTKSSEGKAKSSAKSSSPDTKPWSLTDAIEKQNAAEGGKKENRALSLIKKLKPKAVTDESEMTKDFRPSGDVPATPEPSRTESETAQNQYGTLDTLSAASLRQHAKSHMKKGHVKTARRLAEKAIELDSENTDGRQIYAEALRVIVKRQNPRDPHTYNLCVKQWYWLSKHSEFDDDTSAANAALKDLTGVTPQVWMRTKAYLSKVLMPEEGMTPAELAAEEPEQVR